MFVLFPGVLLRRGLTDLAVFPAVLLGACALSAQAGGPPPTAHGVMAASRVSAPASIDEHVVDSLMTTAMQQRHLVGASIALMRGGRMELVKGYGFASLEPRVPVDTGTRFGIGSVTKEFVAALALLLQEEGRLSVHDTLVRWYPSLTRAGEITLLDLINHVSGYHDYYPLDFVDREMAQTTTAEHIIQEYATQPLDFDPGTRWSYSNTGYTILGRVLERVGGKPLGTLIEERIFRPLGMRQSVYEPTHPGGRATGYTSWMLGDPVPAVPEARGWIGAPGGIWSTPSDLARWDLALMRPGFLSPASRAVLFGERILRDSTPTGYAGGLSITRAGGRTIYHHGGGLSGFAAQNLFIPDDTAAVVVLSNNDQNVPVGPLIPLVSPPRQVTAPVPARRLQPPMRPPTPRGRSALVAALEFFGQLQRGQVDRSQLGADYAAFLTPERVASASRSLAPLGEVTGAEQLAVSERGGMQVASIRLTLATQTITVLMYRAPSGAIEEYLLSP
jgi:CubicO group peptidase (beta-lactamase class C family)